MYNLIFEPTAKPGELLPTSISVVCLIGGQNNLAATSLESLLLVRHHDGKWGLPSGRVELGEEPKAALWRELHEETGLTQDDIIIYRGPETKFFSTGGRRTYPSITMIWKARLKVNLPLDGIQITDSEEINLVRQFSINNLLLLLEEPNKIRIPHHNIPMIRKRILSWLGIMYAFEGPTFYLSIARNWGIIDE